MNKIININLAGRLIPINEDAFVILDNYLKGLKLYFTKEQGGEEIIHDMEDRIGELFQEKIKKGKASIAQEDVEAIIEIMGSPQQIIDETGEDETNNNKEENQRPPIDDEPKKLRRSEKEKIIGGVCGGMANYFNIDPAIVRILFVFVTLAWGSGLILYLVLWAVLPTAEHEQIKLRRRLYRNLDQTVLGGVCSGIAAYFKIDVIWPRLIFLAPILFSVLFSFSDWNAFSVSIGGMPATVLLYLVLWASLPGAHTLTEKLEMQGKKVDVKNISDAVKQQETSSGKKNQQNTQSFFKTLIKIVLIIIGSIIILSILATLFGLIIAFFFAGSSLSIFSFDNLIIESQTQKIILVIAISLLIILPIYGCIRLLTYLISGSKKSSPRWVKLTLLILFIGSIFSLFWIGGDIAKDFKVKYFKKDIIAVQPMLSDTIFITQVPNSSSNEGTIRIWQDDDFDSFFRLNDSKTIAIQTVYLNIVKSPDSIVHIELEKSAYGKNTEKAKHLVAQLAYEFKQDGNAFYFPNEVIISKNNPFRGQSITATIQIPEGKVFYLEDINENSWTKRSYSYKHGSFKIKKERRSKYRFKEDGYYRMNEVGEAEKVGEESEDHDF